MRKRLETIAAVAATAALTAAAFALPSNASGPQGDQQAVYQSVTKIAISTQETVPGSSLRH